MDLDQHRSQRQLLVANSALQWRVVAAGFENAFWNQFGPCLFIVNAIYRIRRRCAAKQQPYFNQPRFLKYHMGTKALATIRTKAIG